MNTSDPQSQSHGNTAPDGVMARIEALATLSESSDALTRRFATPQHRAANDLAATWMRDAGMSVSEDDIGNVTGRYEALTPGAPAIMIGSHLETVVNAGRFDGMLGVLCGIACVEQLARQQIRLPVAIEVVGFADEEGVRYHSTYLGSKAITGAFPAENLDLLDADGISMRDALMNFGKKPELIEAAKRKPDDIAAFLEIHIEQGPVLERENLPLGVVSSISGATRMRVSLHGEAGHAGTVPMNLRRDALCAAAEAIVAIETVCSGQPGLVGTVGSVNALPGASNVIPGEVEFSVDVRAPIDSDREKAVDLIQQEIRQSAAKRNVEAAINILHNEPSICCDNAIVDALSEVVEKHCGSALQLPSGAGHDAAAMAEFTRAGMLFVRCKGGISHNPAESVTPEDADAAVVALVDAVKSLANSLT